MLSSIIDAITTTTPSDPQYPKLLMQISGKPETLYVRGELSGPELCIGIVGSRRMSAYGSQVVERVVAGLMGLPVCIVSGLAFGIDACSHRAALGRGIKTIAVLGSGVDPSSIYPRAHRLLAAEIVAAGGAVISEYPPGAEVHKYNFPMRNRIIAGISRAVAVVEASSKSGALITAGQALDENRDVFAVPGSVFEATSEGTNSLISKGAYVLRDARDIIMKYPELLAAQAEKQQSLFGSLLPKDPTQCRILGLLEPTGSTVEQISSAASISVAEASSTLTILYVEGYVTELSRGVYAKKF